ncbi:hypothetical protein Desor_3113 [Desulfosporosinus orientis DSM 765]|uniref:Uncharacterized protein n=1 Tax=Desulfosporosinus orientis (strain ATCC 19365 / DSM 765 / NCIMB 8382 / VKM B-1628 / Singapore I) TaxID=768706 RepID=G7W6J2_DESOD|nr:hypothetical protein Desor_3113 [Desulfosporosinus orientis DSM 765]
MITFGIITQHFSLYHSQSIDINDIFANYKSVSNSEIFNFCQTSLSAKIRGEKRLK